MISDRSIFVAPFFNNFKQTLCLLVYEIIVNAIVHKFMGIYTLGTLKKTWLALSLSEGGRSNANAIPTPYHLDTLPSMVVF